MSKLPTIRSIQDRDTKFFVSIPPKLTYSFTDFDGINFILKTVSVWLNKRYIFDTSKYDLPFWHEHYNTYFLILALIHPTTELEIYIWGGHIYLFFCV